MAITNITNLTNADTFLDLVSYGNQVTSGVFVSLGVLSISLIIFISLLKNGFSFEKSGATASYVMFIMMLLFFWAGLVPIGYFIGSFVLVIAIIALLAILALRNR